MARRKRQHDDVAGVLDRAKQVGEAPQGFTPVRFGPVLGNEGDEITGIYKGPGKPIPGKKKGTKIGTYMLETGDGGEVRILAAVQIEQFLATVKPGQEVWIRRGPQVKGGKGRVTTYDFAIRKD
jgi:hypothetical protein